MFTVGLLCGVVTTGGGNADACIRGFDEAVELVFGNPPLLTCMRFTSPQAFQNADGSVAPQMENMPTSFFSGGGPPPRLSLKPGQRLSHAATSFSAVLSASNELTDGTGLSYTRSSAFATRTFLSPCGNHL